MVIMALITDIDFNSIRKEAIDLVIKEIQSEMHNPLLYMEQGETSMIL
jgi:hypothetical protein